MGGARYAARQMLENRRRQKPDARRKRAIIFGAGEGGDRTIRAMLWDEHEPVRARSRSSTTTRTSAT